MVRFKKGHKNSNGEPAPWTIVSHETGKILSSHKTKEEATKHLQQMEYFKHAKTESSTKNGLFVSFVESVCKKFDCIDAIEPLVEGFKELF